MNEWGGSKVTPEVVVERLSAISQRQDDTNRRVERVEAALQPLAGLQVLMERLQVDVSEIKSTANQAQVAWAQREQWIENLRESRGGNLRTTTLTLLGLFVSIVGILLSASIGIALKLGGK